MKTTIFLLVFLTTISISRGQSNAVCIYKVFINKDSTLQIKNDDDAVAKDTKNMLSYALELAKDFNYILKFNTSESIFKLDELMLNEATESNYLYPISKALVGEGVYYQNKSMNESFRQVETMGEEFIIKDILLDDWIITDEKKRIGKYNCLKAVKKCKSCKTADEVWFAPEISIPFGPIGYGGLPGLIVEVKKKLLTLRLVSISFKNNEIEIEKPVDGIVVSKNEYREITSGFREKAKKMK